MVKDQAIYTCYHEDCMKQYQSLPNLVRHINTNHLEQSVYVCGSCSTYFTSEKKYTIHKKKHLQVLRFKATHDKFLLSEHYIDDNIYIVPNNILKIPALPRIEAERRDSEFSYKLPLNPEILTALLSYKQ